MEKSKQEEKSDSVGSEEQNVDVAERDEEENSNAVNGHKKEDGDAD